MAEFIPRDLSTPFDPADLDQIAEFEGFACSVPDTTGMIDAVNGVVGATRANVARAAKLFVPALVTGLPAGVADFPTPDVIAPTPGATFERRGLHDQDLNVPLAGGGTTPV